MKKSETKWKVSKKFIFISSIILFFVGFCLHTNVSAHGLKSLDEIVMDLANKVQSLENKVSSTNQDETIPSDLLSTLLKLYEYDTYHYKNFTQSQPLNVVKDELVKENGKYIYKVYVEGDYDWTKRLTLNNDGWISDESGAAYAFYTFIVKSVNSNNDIYGVDVKVAIYDDGVKVIPPVDLK